MRVIVKLAVVVAVLVGGVIGVIGWKNEWFVPTPRSIIRDSFEQANVRNYETANANLTTGMREQFAEDPALMKRIWDVVTKDGTVKSTELIEEDRGFTGTFGDIKLKIVYRDGSAFTCTTKISFHNGRWSFGLREIYQAIREEQAGNPRATPKTKVGMEPTRLQGTDVLLRLPEGCVWDPAKQIYHNRDNALSIHIEKPFRDRSFAAVQKHITKEWDAPDRILVQRTDHSQGETKAMLFDGEAISDNRRGWRMMHFIIGTENRVTLISATFPNQEELVASMREVLTTARLAKD